MSNGTFCLTLFVFIVIFNVDSMGAAVHALHLDAPATLMHDHAGTPAYRALFQLDEIFVLHFILLI
jgi:hypothetical protein